MTEREAGIAEIGTLLEKLGDVIEGHHINIVMATLCVLAGKLGADYFADDKDVFMTRMVMSTSRTFDEHAEADNG